MKLANQFFCQVTVAPFPLFSHDFFELFSDFRRVSVESSFKSVFRIIIGRIRSSSGLLKLRNMVLLIGCFCMSFRILVMCNSRIKTLVELFCNLLVFHIFHDSHVAFAANANCCDARVTSLVAEPACFFG